MGLRKLRRSIGGKNKNRRQPLAPLLTPLDEGEQVEQVLPPLKGEFVQVDQWRFRWSEDQIEIEDVDNPPGMVFTWDEWFDTADLHLGEDTLAKVEVELAEHSEFYREIMEEREAMRASIAEFRRSRSGS